MEATFDGPVIILRVTPEHPDYAALARDIWSVGLSQEEPPDDPFRALAEFYADLWNVTGMVPDEHEVETVGGELADGEWVLYHDGDGWKVKAGDSSVQLAQARAPKGGVQIGPKFFRGGQWIPSADLAKADPQTQAKVKAEAQAHHDKRASRGPVDTKKMRERLSPHDAHELTPQDLKKAKLSYQGLKQHHGELVVHRLEEVAEQLHREHEKAKDPQKKQEIGRRLRAVGHMLDMAEAEQPKAPESAPQKPQQAPQSEQAPPEAKEPAKPAPEAPKAPETPKQDVDWARIDKLRREKYAAEETADDEPEEKSAPAKPVEPHTVPFDQWEENLRQSGEWKKYSKKQLPKGALGLKIAHREEVAHALKQGKEVPPEVMRAYPDLVRRHGRPKADPGATAKLYERAATDPSLDYAEVDRHLESLKDLPKSELLELAKSVDVTVPASASKGKILEEMGQSIKGRRGTQERVQDAKSEDRPAPVYEKPKPSSPPKELPKQPEPKKWDKPVPEPTPDSFQDLYARALTDEDFDFAEVNAHLEKLAALPKRKVREIGEHIGLPPVSGETKDDYVDRIGREIKHRRGKEERTAALALDEPETAVDEIVERATGAGLVITDHIRADIKKAAERASDPPDFLKRVRAVLQEYQPYFAQALSDATLAGWLSAGRQVMQGFTTPPPPPAVPGTFDPGVPAPPPPVSVELPDDEPLIRYPIIDEAVESMAARRVLTQDAYNALSAQEKSKAFTVAGVESEAVLERLEKSLSESIATGGSLKEFAEEVDEVLGEGVMSDAHIELVFRTNIGQAFKQGQKAVLENEFVKSEFPYVRYIATHDDRVRPEHLALERMGIQGTDVYRADDLVAQKFWAPWDFNCRCAMIPLSIEDAARRGILEAREWLATGRPPANPTFVEHPPFDLPKGWK